MSCIVPRDNIITNNKIFVIGDLHADYQKTVELFKHFNLIDNNNKWIGRNQIVVQLGDQIDGYGRGVYEDASGEIDILNFFDKIHLEASAYGGGVYSIIGNHELMNVMGNFSYVSRDDMIKNGGSEERRIMYAPGSILAKRLACTRNTIIKINDIIFVHGGIIPELVKNDRENVIKIINGLMRSYFRGEIDENNTEFKKFLNSNKGVVWDRSLGVEEPNCRILDTTLDKLGAKHIIVGHTPQDVINSKCNEKVWRIDVGLSTAMGGNNFQVLEITRENDKNTFKVLT